MTPRRVLFTWLLALAVGSVLVSLPDTGEPVLRISRTHGPGPLDLVGIACIGVGAVALWWWLIRRRREITVRLGRVGLLILALLLSLGLAEVAWSVLSDNGPWWIIGASLAMAVQLTALAASADSPAQGRSRLLGDGEREPHLLSPEHRRRGLAGALGRAKGRPGGRAALRFSV